jgi:hypothetical protein
MTNEEELRHLAEGARPAEAAGGLGLVELVALAEDAGQLLLRCRQVLECVLRESGHRWPTLDQWRQILPAWFVDACAPERTVEEDAAILDGRFRLSDDAPWTLSEWLGWLEPDNRQWFWWDSLAEGRDRLRIIVEIADWPTPLGSLRWLVKASGALGFAEERAG